MEVREAVIDYLRDIAHLEPKSQVGFRQRLTVFAQWVWKLCARNDSKHYQMIANMVYFLHEVKSVCKTAGN
jgi:hypothetical protein